ncbi:hypothetical protein [Ructibacterium gallinarum]|nr:hypothetical protein [Ructibacterium gallinarum]
MTRTYRHIKEYENEIISLKEEGYTKREIEISIQANTQLHNTI